MKPLFNTLIIRTIVFLLGLIFFIPALNTIKTYAEFVFFGERVIGVISHPASSRDFGGRPLIEYQDGQGVIHEFKSRAKTHWFHTPQKGEELIIYISNEDPGKAIVKNLIHYLLLPLLFLMAGGFCLFRAFFITNDDGDEFVDDDSPHKMNSSSSPA